MVCPSNCVAKKVIRHVSSGENMLRSAGELHAKRMCCPSSPCLLIPFLGVAESSDFFLIHFCGFSFDGLFVRKGSYETDDFVAPDSMVYS